MRETDRDRDTERHTQRVTGRQTDRQTETETERETETETEREGERASFCNLCKRQCYIYIAASTHEEEGMSHVQQTLNKQPLTLTPALRHSLGSKLLLPNCIRPCKQISVLLKNGNVNISDD